MTPKAVTNYGQGEEEGINHTKEKKDWENKEMTLGCVMNLMIACACLVPS